LVVTRHFLDKRELERYLLANAGATPRRVRHAARRPRAPRPE
jgi:hypothetical protein